ncbi:tetratricopeptide repeat protein [Lysobacter korlensis]|uniref:Tetratricopeptide repeat protein n=1 Tax=Lysobacter korlensis TaxID=553636 RepID=A0ABV6RJK7_9GAMM
MLLAGCATQPAAPDLTEPPGAATRVEMVETIRAAGVASDDELEVRPLREGAVEDLRERAQALQAQGDYPQAAALLDEALERHGADPTVLQERAEAAVLVGDFDAAERFSRRAIEIGTQVGPLCRRHWTLLEQVAQAQLAGADAAESAGLQSRVDAARREREACTVAAPARY